MQLESRDPLDMTVREFLEKLLAGHSVDDIGWVNIRSPEWPWQSIVSAAERGEVRVSRVGRKLLMRRDELDKWLDAHCIPRKQKQRAEPKEDVPDDDMQRMLDKAGFGGRKRLPV